MNNQIYIKKYPSRAHVPLLIGALYMSSIVNTSIAQNLLTNNFNNKNGLSQNTITAIVQDSQGFMWFGTQDGLNRFDGYEFKVYKPNANKADAITSNSIWSLMVDKKGLLWIGTYAGLNRYDFKTDQFIAYQHDPNNNNSLSHNDVRSILEDNQGNIWVATQGGLNRFNPVEKTFTRILHDPKNENSISSNNINVLFKDSASNLWVGTNDGIDKYDFNTQRFMHPWENPHTENDRTITLLKKAIILSIAEDQLGRLWIATDGEGLFVYDKNENSLTQHKHDLKNATSLSSNRVRAVYSDSKGQLWFGTHGGGLNTLKNNQNQFIRYRKELNNPNNLNDDTIYSFYEDNMGIFWIGTYSRGIFKLNASSFSSTLVSDKATNDNPHPQSDLRAFYVDSHKALWTGSGGGGIRITHANGTQQIHMHDPNNPLSLSRNEIFSIMEDKTGTVWVGSEAGWLNRYDRKTQSFTRYHSQTNDNENIQHGKIRSIMEDRAGTFWVGIDGGGLHTFNRKTGQFTHYHHDANTSDSISNNNLFSIHEDRAGNIWVTTFGGGLNKFNRDTQTFTHYVHQKNNKNSLSHNYLTSIHEDTKEDVLWLGSYGGGLNRFDLKTNTFTHFTERDDLANNAIYGILQDDKGLLWITSNNGLSRFNPKTKIFKNYDERDGLQSNEFNGGAHYRAPDGKFYIGGTYGYNAFYPDQIVDNLHKPVVYITEFQLFNKTININQQYNNRVLLPYTISTLDKLTLSHKDDIFSLNFVALDYTLSAKNQYAYKMEGLEENWNYVGDRRFATYTTLPSGNYTFRVKASNNDGIWNEEGAALGIIITPPIWKTWWFKTLLSIFIVLIIFAIYTARVSNIKKRNEILKSEVQTRTAELEKQKANLEETLSELHETKDAFKESSQIASGVLHNVGNLLNSINTSSSIIQDIIYRSVISRYTKANELLRANINNIEEFIINNPKGKKLLNYYLELENSFLDEKNKLNDNTNRLIEKVAAVKETITAQQRSAKGLGFIEELSLKTLLEDSIRLQTESIESHGIIIHKNFNELPNIKIEKAKLFQILLNLYKNAKESILEAQAQEKIITIALTKDEHSAYIKVSDTGLGIDPEKINKLFSYGFTTKSEGHGFGLHSCANYMEGMSGKIWAESEGLGKGATFILQIPLTGVSPKEAPPQKKPLLKIAGKNQ